MGIRSSMVPAPASTRRHQRWVVLATRPLPDDASHTEFCDYWTNFPQAAVPGGTDALSPEGSRAQAESMATLGTPSDAPRLVRDGLEMRVRYLEAAGDEDPRQAGAVLASLSDEENHAAWFGFEKYVAHTCP